MRVSTQRVRVERANTKAGRSTMGRWFGQSSEQGERGIGSRSLGHAPLLALVVGLVGTLSAATAVADDTRCENVSFSVTIGGPLPGPYRIVGELCTPNHVTRAPLQLLVHGATYNHLYWDFPFDPDHYSYVRHASQRAS